MLAFFPNNKYDKENLFEILEMHSFMSLDVRNQTVLKLTQYLLKKFPYELLFPYEYFHILRRNSGRGIPLIIIIRQLLDRFF